MRLSRLDKIYIAISAIFFLLLWYLKIIEDLQIIAY